MGSTQKVLMTGCLVLVGIAGLLVGGVILLAFFGKKPAPWAQRLAELPAGERSTLDEVVKAAGIAITDLRDVGQGAPLDDERNARAIAIEGGHVRMLSLQRATRPLPSLSAWGAMETLSLRGAGLTELPDLSGCAHLETLDVAKNQIGAVDRGKLPSSLRVIDLSENPMSDLSPLASLAEAREIRAHHTRVTTFDALLDSRLTLLDLRGDAIEHLPARLPKSEDFRVDLQDCPVSTPPGYLTRWSFKIRESGTVGGVQTQKGMVTTGKWEVTGTWREVPHLTTVSLATPSDMSSGPGVVDLEVGVEEGRLRVYLTAPGEVRGPWFEKGYVKGAGGIIQAVAMLYADAAPGKPAHLRGNLERIASQPFYCYVEPLEGAVVRGMSYRVWRD